MFKDVMTEKLKEKIKKLEDAITQKRKTDNLDSKAVNIIISYFSDDKSERIYKWCLAFNKESA